MSSSLFDRVQALRVVRDGTMSVVLTDGTAATMPLAREPFEHSSAFASSTYLPQSRELQVVTRRGDTIVFETPAPDDLAPVKGRPTIYLDQNHWSALANAVHAPERVPDERERTAALKLIQMATDREAVLPLSSAHMAESCKQVDLEKRYPRALTMLRLSAGWQLRDPLALRSFELRQALTTRYRNRCLPPAAAVTLEPDAIHAARDKTQAEAPGDLPLELGWVFHAIDCIGGIADTMLDADHVPMNPVPGWAAGFQQFTDFLKDNPSSKEMKRGRTHAKFMDDTRGELAAAAIEVGVTAEEFSEWYLDHSEDDVSRMPALGLFREVLHEKLSTGTVRWEGNDLFDMMYLTAGAAYCDHLVGERSHSSHLGNALRRLDRPGNVHRSLRSLMEQI
ncbi:hypothetical protein [Amycolatopsis sp. NPDC003676]